MSASQGDSLGSYDAYQPRGDYGDQPVRPSTYLEGAPVDFGGAATGALRHIFTYEGRASRSAYWWFALVEVVVYAITGILFDWSWAAGAVVTVLLGLPAAIAGIALAVRRLHDSDRSGWWWWLFWVPILGWIPLLYFYLLPGTPDTNRYSPPSAFTRPG
jgi:uncharacterized membrane protein YhaH (DUF805 family)